MFDRVHTLSLSGTALTSREASGGLAIDLGMVPARRHQVPSDWPSPILRFLDNESSSCRPATSSTRPSSPSRPSKPAARLRRPAGGDSLATIAAA